MEGTCTGEHGVGIGKQRYLAAEVMPETLGLMRTLKQTLDPKGILNPGKIITSARFSTHRHSKLRIWAMTPPPEVRLLKKLDFLSPPPILA